MKSAKYILFFCCCFLLSTCQNKESVKPAHFRALTMIQYSPATLTIQGKGNQSSIHQTLPLSYGTASKYQTLAPGHYEITLSIKDKDLLKGDYVLGKSGYYTLLATGLMPEEWKVNPQTMMYQLKHIFAGEELSSTNSYLPQWFMMRDNYDGSQKNAYIRLVNANPHTPALTIKKGDTSLKNGLAYPIESGMQKLKPGSYKLSALYGKIPLAEKKINPQPGYIYTAIIGSKMNAPGDLLITILKNPSRTLLNNQ